MYKNSWDVYVLYACIHVYHPRKSEFFKCHPCTCIWGTHTYSSIILIIEYTLFFMDPRGLSRGLVFTRKHFPHYWPFVMGIPWTLVDSHDKGPIMMSFNIFFVGAPTKLLKKQWFETTWLWWRSSMPHNQCQSTQLLSIFNFSIQIYHFWSKNVISWKT